MEENLAESPIGPILFVFDNFETVSRPLDVFSWLDTFIRLPNKILITTRHREFKGDYFVEVAGMTEEECQSLIDETGREFRVTELLTESYRQDLINESGGHPYVIKILLGELSKSRKLQRVERIVASHDEILDALFERTYEMLTPAAKRVFLTLSNWRSVVPELSLQAVLLRPQNELIDVDDAVEELQATVVRRNHPV